MSVRWTLAVIGLVILTACGGGNKIITVDQSADYKSAASLPPLKKPSKAAASSVSVESIPDSIADVEVEVEVEVEVDSENTSSADAYIPRRIDSAPEELVESLNLEEPLASEESLAAEEPLSVITDDATKELENDAELATLDTLNARVISPKNDVSRLQVEAEFDDAWGYLSRRLQRSDVTVFSRNKAAGRFAIGCSGIESSSTADKKGGWSFFNKRSTLEQEYCALQAVATKGATIVTVLNRFNEEIAGESAAKVFSRILNN